MDYVKIEQSSSNPDNKRVKTRWGSSTRFEFFQPGFAYMVVLNFIFVVLDAEFCAELNGVIFKGGCRSKSGTLPGNTAFSENLVEVIPARIRCFSCAGSGNDCVEFRMKFCIE
ncbi:unnamed protein product [Rotaria socialis]